MGRTTIPVRDGAITAASYAENSAKGMAVGIWDDKRLQHAICACLEDRDDDGLVLLVNDGVMSRYDMRVIHTDIDWNPIGTISHANDVNAHERKDEICTF